MGTVFLAYDRRLDRRVAVKRLRRDKGRGRKRLQSEARATAALAHPAIVQVFDFVEGDDGDWIVMEYIDGPVLAQLLRDGPLEISVALGHARDIANGLAYAHGEGILHCDLKTENVMISPLGRAKILDFGLAERVTEAALKQQGQVAGTLRAMSPEQARGFELDERSDLFSFGTLLYECLTARSPFQDPDAATTLSRVLSHQQTPVRDLDPRVPRRLSDLVDRLLEKLPEARPESAGDVAGELVEIADRLDQPERRTQSSHETSGELLDLGETIDYPSTGATSATEAPLTSSTRSRSSTYASAIAGRRRPLLLAALAMLLVLAFGTTRPEIRSWIAGARQSEPIRPLPAIEPDELARQGFAALERHDKPGHIDRAIDAFKAALAWDGSHAMSQAGLGRAYWRNYFTENRDPLWLEQGLGAARRALEIDNTLVAARLSLGFLESETGRYDAAVEQFEQVSAVEPDNAEAQRGLADVALARGDLKQAEAGYLRAIEMAPESWELQSLLGALYFQSSRYAEAKAAFQRVAELTPDNYTAYRDLSVLAGAEDRYDEAIELADRSLEIRPSASAYNNLGTSYFWQNRYDEAMDPFEQAVKLGANNSLYWANLGDAYRQIPGKDNDAREAYLQAVQKIRKKVATAPEDGELRSRLAVNLAKRGDQDAAIAAADEARKLAGNHPVTWFKCALTYELVGRRDLALEALANALDAGYPLKSIRRDPDLTELRKDIAYHKLIVGFDHQGTQQLQP